MPITATEKRDLFREFLGWLKRGPGSRGVLSHRDLADVGPLDHQQSGGGGSVGGTGIANKLAKWITPSILGSSIASDNGTTLTVAGDVAITGTITSGTWHGTAVGTQYGGTGQNFSATARGTVLYFSAAGVMSALAPSTDGFVLTTHGAGADPTWTAASAGTVTGSGTTGKIPKWTGSSALGDSLIAESGSVVTVTGSLTTTADLTVTGKVPTPLKIGNGSNSASANISYQTSDNSAAGMTLAIWNESTATNSFATIKLYGNNGGVQAQFYADGLGGSAVYRTFTNHPLVFGTNATSRWQIAATGHLLAATDNTYDIGATGATRPRHLFLGGDLAHQGTNVGFYNVATVARQLLATGAGHTVDDVITALQTLGLLRQS